MFFLTILPPEQPNSTHTLSDHWVQQVVVRAEDDDSILQEFTGSKVGAGTEPSAQRDQVLDVPGHTEAMDLLEHVLVPHLLDPVVVAT